MKIKLKWKLPGDFSGGLMLFGIVTIIAIIELYILKRTATQAIAKGLFQPGQGIAGGSLGGIGFGRAGKQIFSCERTWKGNKKRIQQCKDAIRGAKPVRGGSALSSEQKRILTQSQQ